MGGRLDDSQTPLRPKDLRRWLTSFRSGLEHVDGILHKFTTSQTLAETDKELSLWKELGGLSEKLIYQEWDRVEQLYRYSSGRAAYSIVMPRGWVLETPGLLKHFTNLRPTDPMIDMVFMRTGHFGDQIRPPGFDAISTIPGQRLQLSDLYSIMGQSQMFRRSLAAQFNGLRDFEITQRKIAEHDGILITAKFGPAIRVGKIHYALINTPDLSLWVHCTNHSGAPVDDCKSAIDSLSFNE